MGIKLYIGDIELSILESIFPGGEVYIKIDAYEDNRFNRFKIIANITQSNDVMKLLMITDAIRRKFSSDACIDLVMPYIPYARQDRVCCEGESLSIKVFCDLINSQKYDSVEVWDSHSEVALALLDNVFHREQWEFVKNIELPSFPCTTIIAPDAGAMKKAQKCFDNLKAADLYFANKTRDVRTGEILGTDINMFTTENNILVVDDICDGGRTFIELAKKLKELTSGDLYLYTTHGIYSKGLRPLLKYYSHIYTANPFAENVNGDYVTVVKHG